ncbi:ABC transporter ATP-binding protein [Rhodococcus sp. 06-156-3C]|uniref:ABC transporter ATP-binding protein n=1 Tax=Nocardiaceae TaxID=85025 RepID=UPI000522E9B7|nr:MULTISPECIES: ABC transporter ATP-binding protein [Rhodococcus]OZD10832.1 ABC transporter ATP-binding protein [Rhodococcus sp. 06-156-4C]OZD11507.1 ABC transporter ATP-binding protein [Rhodococcus sp. 06-156-3C]OZD13742.1 ABC transporter ATP-binding protein [Rhodococcus sp. 06-156-4a]OZD28111.1 ABC transporter ATP-binding protein [Rhodococcus sp. 06-156-3b]OZD30366.1 ABC transporter ATP-binding protein [Rhodococcus sp. 06-156-3]
MTATAELRENAHSISDPAPLLAVRDLAVAYDGNLNHPTVSGVSFDVRAGSTVAIVGESGSGKSTVVGAVLKLLGDRVAVGGTAEFGERDILRLRERDFRRIRGRRIGFVPQDPTASLNPVRRIDRQIFEAFRSSGLPEYAQPKNFHDQAVALLDSVGIPTPERALHSYPHQLSGGQLQRVLIGIAISQRPALIVADEPTSALDVTIQKTILDLIDRLKTERDLSVLLITHDLSLAAERADTVVVLNRGRVEESGTSAEVLADPKSAYARNLIGDIPSIDPDRFAAAKAERAQPDTEPALSVVDIHKAFDVGRHRIQALDGVSFEIPAGRTHALVGESGSGKSTLARLVLRLEEPDAGQIVVAGQDISHLGTRGLRDARRHLQLVYQNPFHSLDPTYSVEQLVAEPLVRYKIGSRTERRERAVEVLDLVGLDQTFLRRRIRALSGGQRQRVAIARALSLSPKVLVLDEPTSALDVTVQAQILQVLIELQVRLGVSYLFISHDLSVVRQLSDTVTVLRRGVVQEAGRTEDVFSAPTSEYTRKLVRSIPTWEPNEKGDTA